MKLAGSALLPALLLLAQLGGGGPLRATQGSGSKAAEQIERAVRNPLPPLPPAPASRADQVWVPDRFLPTPTGGQIHVPAHWEQRLSDHEYRVPPLTVCDQSTGQCATTAPGVRGPASTRPEP